MRPPSENLWQNQRFLKLWSAQTTSAFGTQIASLAYPLTAILFLQASPFQMGVLRAVGSASAVVIGFFVGAVVDRVSGRALLIFTDLGRAFLAVLIPIAAFSGILQMEHLYVIAFLAGTMNITSEVAGMAFLPSLIDRQHLVEGNSKFATTESLAVTIGPSMSGLLVQILSAPAAIIADAVSFVFSALLIWLIPASTSSSSSGAPQISEKDIKKSIWSEIIEGLNFVYKNPILRPLAETIALHFLFMLLISTVFTLYAIRELRIEPFLFGIIFSASGIGFLLGAIFVKTLTRRFGQGKTMIGATLLNAFACSLLPLAGGSLTIFILITAHFLLGFGIQIHGINLMSLRQSITPAHLQGRMNGSFRFVNVCMMMVGALIGGFLGELIGLRATLAVGAVGIYLPFLRLFFSPLQKIYDTTELNRL